MPSSLLRSFDWHRRGGTGSGGQQPTRTGARRQVMVVLVLLLMVHRRNTAVGHGRRRSSRWQRDETVPVVVDVAVAAQKPRPAQTVFDEAVLLVEDGRVAGVGAAAGGATRSGTAVGIHVDFVPYDRTAGLRFVEPTPLEQPRQRNVKFLVDLRGRSWIRILSFSTST